MSEREKDDFFKRMGISYDEWKKVYLPEYDAPAAVYHNLYTSLTGSQYDDFDIAAQNVEIADEAFFDEMRKEFPQNLPITDGETSSVIREFEKRAGASTSSAGLSIMAAVKSRSTQ